MYALGEIYQKDLNYKKSLEYYTMAMERGHPESFLKCGLMYFNGEGVDKDLRKARGYLLNAHQRGIGDVLQIINYIDKILFNNLDDIIEYNLVI